MSKYIFEFTEKEVNKACEGYEDCMGCKFMYNNGTCAKDMIRRTDKPLKELLEFLLKEIDV